MPVDPKRAIMEVDSDGNVTGLNGVDVPKSVVACLGEPRCPVPTVEEMELAQRMVTAAYRFASSMHKKDPA